MVKAKTKRTIMPEDQKRYKVISNAINRKARETKTKYIEDMCAKIYHCMKYRKNPPVRLSKCISVTRITVEQR